jgi:hypothetical protein
MSVVLELCHLHNGIALCCIALRDYYSRPLGMWNPIT